LNSGNNIFFQFFGKLNSIKPRKQSERSLVKSVIIKLLDDYILASFKKISVVAKSLKISDNLLKWYNDADSLLYISLLDYEILIKIFN